MARKRGIFNEIGHNRGSFVVAFLLAFVLCVVFLAALDALPEVPKFSTEVGSMFTDEQPTVVSNPEAPVRVVAKAVGVDVAVLNPASADVTALDESLLKGAIRYPTSALLGQEGTVLLFGHSSGLPIVHNQNFKAFNGIQKLGTGSTISVYSDSTEYRYSVTNVRLANAEEDVIELPQNGKFLTLVTCNNSISNKTGRYVVTAEFVGAYPHSN